MGQALSESTSFENKVSKFSLIELNDHLDRNDTSTCSLYHHISYSLFIFIKLYAKNILPNMSKFSAKQSCKRAWYFFKESCPSPGKSGYMLLIITYSSNNDAKELKYSSKFLLKWLKNLDCPNVVNLMKNS